MNWSEPKDVSDIRSFMGVNGYYQKFIEWFYKIAYPLTSLQKKGTKFIWSEKCQESFYKLKQLLTTTPILKLVDLDKDFLVCMDACHEGLGGVLMQENHVIVYESQKLKKNEENYITHVWELAAIIHALKMWRHYLVGRKLLLLTDNIALKYVFDKHNLNSHQERWLAFLSEYDFEIKHIKGK
jgi:hypothetical protein